MKTRGPVPRRFWGLPHLMVLLSLFLAACAPSQPAAPKAETKPTEAAKTAPAPAPAASPAAAPAAKPAESPAAAAPAKPAASPVAAPAAAPAASPAAAPAAPAASPAAAAKPAAKPISLPPPEKTSLKMAHATLETSQLAYAVAALNGLYKKYGLDVELLFTEGDGKTLQTLVAGGADVSTQGISTAISSQVTDVPLTVVSMTATTLTDAIVSSSDVKTKEDLRGKAVAISTFGGTSHAAAVLALQSMGMTPNDVNIVQVGGQSARIAALRGGSVAAAVVDVAVEEEMKQQGFNILTRLPDTPLEFGRNGMLVRQDWVTQNPNTVLALTAGTLEGQNMIWTDSPKAVESFMKWAQITDRARAESEVEFFKKYGNRDMRWTKEGWERARDILSVSNPEVKDVDVTKAYTFQFLDRLREVGLYDQLGIPARR